MDALARAKAAQESMARNAAESQRLAAVYAAAVADLVAEAGTQEAAAELLGVGQSRIAALVKRARALAETRP